MPIFTYTNTNIFIDRLSSGNGRGMCHVGGGVELRELRTKYVKYETMTDAQSAIDGASGTMLLE
ncbi:hypothetical protein B0H17DRAFT_1190219 [Mycena rosella]|uniref:Uncharacterized protein n=1 Tax=Mycena rosella TaxID=1033263 RepID=A0AAD7H349_MYCRO|nr:hypothetical protein B0H17DRAFT_1190219 [Mycena rosella]